MPTNLFPSSDFTHLGDQHSDLALNDETHQRGIAHGYQFGQEDHQAHLHLNGDINDLFSPINQTRYPPLPQQLHNYLNDRGGPYIAPSQYDQQNGTIPIPQAHPYRSLHEQWPTSNSQQTIDPRPHVEHECTASFNMGTGSDSGELLSDPSEGLMKNYSDVTFPPTENSTPQRSQRHNSRGESWWDSMDFDEAFSNTDQIRSCSNGSDDWIHLERNPDNSSEPQGDMSYFNKDNSMGNGTSTVAYTTSSASASASASNHGQEIHEWGPSSELTMRAVAKSQLLQEGPPNGLTNLRSGVNIIHTTNGPVGEQSLAGHHVKVTHARRQRLDNPHPSHYHQENQSRPGSPAPHGGTRCPECTVIFTGLFAKGNLGRHRRTKHRPRPCKCEVKGCDRIFARTDARLKHYRKDHLHLSLAPAIPRKTPVGQRHNGGPLPENTDREDQREYDLRYVGSRH